MASCYTSALSLCREHRIGSVSFPSISTGVYGYPLDQAAPVALSAVRDAIGTAGTSLCRFMLFDEATVEVYRQAAEAIFGSD